MFLEKTPAFAQISFDSSHSVRTFVEIFWGCVLEVIIIISPNFEPLWTRFDPQIIEFSKVRRLEKLCSARAGFLLLSSVEPKLVFFCVGSTDA